MTVNASGRPLRPDAAWEVRYETQVSGVNSCFTTDFGWMLLRPDPGLYAAPWLRALRTRASICPSSSNVPPIRARHPGSAGEASVRSTPEDSPVSNEEISWADSARVADHSGILDFCW